MSKENVTHFFKALETDKDLQEKVAAHLKEIQPADEQSVMAHMVDLASEYGFTFDVTEMKSAADNYENDAELSDEAIENVVGAGTYTFILTGDVICCVPGGKR